MRLISINFPFTILDKFRNSSRLESICVSTPCQRWSVITIKRFNWFNSIHNLSPPLEVELLILSWYLDIFSIILKFVAIHLLSDCLGILRLVSNVTISSVFLVLNTVWILIENGRRNSFLLFSKNRRLISIRNPFLLIIYECFQRFFFFFFLFSIQSGLLFNRTFFFYSLTCLIHWWLNFCKPINLAVEASFSWI